MDEAELQVIIVSKVTGSGFAQASAETQALTSNTGGLSKAHVGATGSSKKFEESMHSSAVVMGDTGGHVDDLSRKLGGLQSLMGGGLGMTVGALAATAAIGLAIEGGKAAEAQSEANVKANADLAQSFRVQGQAVESYLPSINKWLNENREVIPDVNQAKDGLASFVRAGFSYPTAIDAMNASLNVAALKHVDLATASKQVLLGMEGNARGLKDLGIDLKSLTADDENAIKAHREFETATTEVATATKAHDVAVQHLSDVQAELRGKTTLTTAEQIRLRDAQQKVADTTNDLSKANGDLTKAQSDVNDSMSTAKQVLDEVTKKTDGGTKSVTDLERKQNDANRQWADFADKIGPDVVSAHAGLLAAEATLLSAMDNNYGKAKDLIGTLQTFESLGSNKVNWSSFFGGLHSELDSIGQKLGGVLGALQGIGGGGGGGTGGVQGGGGWAAQGGGWNP